MVSTTAPVITWMPMPIQPISQRIDRQIMGQRSGEIWEAARPFDRRAFCFVRYRFNLRRCVISRCRRASCAFGAGASSLDPV